MERVLEKLLEPAVLAMCIPVLAILTWGLVGIIRAARGEPEESEEVEELKTEIQTLRARLDKLEESQKVPV